MLRNFTVFLISLVLLFYSQTLTAQNSCEIQKWAWAENIASEPYQLFSKSVFDRENQLYVGGSFENFLSLGDTTLSSEGFNSYLAKYNSAGMLLWVKIVEENAGFVDLSIVNDRLFILSTHRNNPEKELWTLSEFNLEGETIWAFSPEKFKRGFPLSLFIDRHGNSYVSGTFEDTIQVGNIVKIAESEYGDGFVAKFSEVGNFQWITQIPYFNVAGIASNSKGEVYAAGSTFEPFEFGGQLINLYEDATAGGFFLKFSADGDALSYRYVAKAPIYSDLGAIAIDKADNIVVGGSFESTYMSPDDTSTTIIGTNRYTINYSFVAKYSANEEFLWSDTLTAGSQNTVVKIEFDDRGEIYLAENQFIAHRLLNYSNDGIFNWERVVTETFSTYAAEFSFDLSPDKLTICVAGNYDQTAQFGSIVLTPENPGNAYLAQLKLNATLNEPSQPSAKIQVSYQTPTSAHLSWENGDGTGRLVLLKKLGKVNPFNIQDRVEYTDGAGKFGAGTQTGEREFVVYVGEGSETTITGLQPGRPYQIAVIEYNDSLSCSDLTNYLQEDVAKKIFLTPGRSKFSVYPNPFTQEVVNISLPEGTSGEDVLSLRNAYGRKVLQRHINKLAGEGNEVKLDVTALNLPSGIYYLHLTGQAAIRLVKK